MDEAFSGGEIERRQATRKINLNDYKLKEANSRTNVGQRQRFQATRYARCLPRMHWKKTMWCVK